MSIVSKSSDGTVYAQRVRLAFPAADVMWGTLTSRTWTYSGPSSSHQYHVRRAAQHAIIFLVPCGRRTLGRGAWGRDMLFEPLRASRRPTRFLRTIRARACAIASCLSPCGTARLTRAAAAADTRGRGV